MWTLQILSLPLKFLSEAEKAEKPVLQTGPWCQFAEAGVLVCISRGLKWS